MDRFCYSAYGLILESAFPLPELAELPGAGIGRADISIENDSQISIASDKPTPIECRDAALNWVHLVWGGVGDLFIENGNRILVRSVLKSDKDAIRLFIFGAGLGVLLHQRGLLVLHGSGVALNNQVIGFIADKGAGKSTMAAAFCQHGHGFISDDLLVVYFDAQDKPMVIPAPPQMRLWLDTLIYAGGRPDSATRVRSGIDKFNFNVDSVAKKPIPLHSLYLLDAEGSPHIEKLFPSEALFSIIPHLYVSRFGTSVFQKTDPAGSFKKLTLLSKQAHVKRLVREQDISQLPNIVNLIEGDLHSDHTIQ